MLMVVAVALVNPARQVFVQKRPVADPLAGLWEFPGGKIEGSESPEAALVREIDEELGIKLRAEDLHPIAFAYDGTASSQPILILLFKCSAWQGEIEVRFADDVAWVNAQQLLDCPMPPIDIDLREQLLARLEE